MSRRTLAFRISTLVVLVVFLGSGFANVLHARHVAEEMAKLGYPAYFSTLLGLWKILGAVAVAVPSLPRLKEWAYAGIIFDVTGAAFSRAAVGSEASGVLPPLVVAAVVFVSWASRPDTRVLRSAAGA